jgi:hypothetical protein
MDKPIKGMIVACFSLGVSLLAAAPAWSVAAQETTPLASATLDELDEIVVNGQRMERRMLESEQRFYNAYNLLNTNKDFAVTCKFVRADQNPGAYGASRYTPGCVPVFYANAMADEAGEYMGSSCGADSFSPFDSRTFTASTSGNSYAYTSNGSSSDGFFFINGQPRGWGGADPVGGCIYVARPPSEKPHLMWLDRRAAFEENLMKVMRSNPQLQSLGGQFQSLIDESRDAQKLAADARKLRVELKLAARKCPAPTSPRSLTKACKSG